MKEHNPDNPILHEAVNGSPAQHTPAKTPKKRDLDTMINGFQGSTSSAPQTFPIPKPNLERDFQMSVQLNPKISVGPGIWGQRNWVSFISGHWNGRWGKGTVVPGGQDSQLIAPDLSTHIDANYLLQTHDHPPAFVAVKMDGWRVGPRDILEKLEDPTQIDEVDPKTYSFRVYVHMETGDARRFVRQSFSIYKFSLTSRLASYLRRLSRYLSGILPLKCPALVASPTIMTARRSS
ncbi:MAG: hypothetical protein Q9225_003873 [Loekoesia sp. 1 TL-2023]